MNSSVEVGVSFEKAGFHPGLVAAAVFACEYHVEGASQKETGH